MILNAIAENLKRRSKDDFKGRHFEAWLIVQAVTWCLRYPLSYRDLEEMFRERGFEVDHSTINRCVLAYAPVIEKRLLQFVDRTVARSALMGLCQDPRQVALPVSGDRQAWEPDRLPADRHARSRCRQALLPKMLKDEPMLSPEKTRTDGAVPSRQQSSHGSDFCIPIRFITSPNIFSKASGATTSA